MLKTHHNYVGLVLVFFLILSSFWSLAQEKKDSYWLLTSYLEQLERTHNIKFSYADKDLQNIKIITPSSENLVDILKDIKTQTQLTIQQLNERYYTITLTTINVCGIIVDNFEKGLEGASITSIEKNKATISTVDGRFEISNISPKDVFKIQHIGFKPFFINAAELASSTACKTIKLSLVYQELTEVIVYNFLTTGLKKQQDASIILKTNNFGILPGLIEPDILQTVQALPGIKSIDETVSDINVRGGTNDQNLILWDGIKMYQSGHFFGLISAFNPYLTDKVTIIKNGTSAAYGDGISSVIQMESKNIVSDTVFGGLGMNFISADVFGQIPLTNKIGFQFSGRRSFTDLINTPTYTRFFERAFQDSEVINQISTDELRNNEDFYFYDFTGKLLYDINDRQKLRFSFISMTNLLDYEEENTTSAEITNSNLTQTNFSIGTNLVSKWNSDFSTHLNMYYTRYTLDSENLLANTIQELSQRNEVFETALHFSSSYNFSQQLNWHNGYQLNEVGITNFTNVTQPPFRSNTKGVIRTQALFSEFEYTSDNKKLWGRAGVRANYIENIDTFQKILLEPRVNANYQIAEALNINFQGEFKNQTTNQVIDLKQNFLGIEKRRWVLADEETLPITKSKQTSVGVSYDKQKLYIGLEGFYKYVNGISTLTQGFQNEDQFNGEIGTYTVTGLEFLINQKTKTISNWFSYTYNNNTYSFNSLTPASFPNNLDIAHTLTFASTYTYNHLKLGVGLNYRTGRPFTEPQEGANTINTDTFPFVINYSSANSSRVSDYIRADASLLYDFNLTKKIKATMGASVLNILNKRNILNTYYRLNDANEIETIENVSLGITPNVSFRVFF
ncbi:MAG: TonB-dependent receptor [Cellulophaga sp.]|nr:TonB-dependent receptor [Cellulophaga sp.]